MARRQVNQLDMPVGKIGVSTDGEDVGPFAHKGREGRVDPLSGAAAGAGAGADDLGLQPDGTGSRFEVSQCDLGSGTGRIDEHGDTSGNGHQFAQEIYRLGFYAEEDQ